MLHFLVKIVLTAVVIVAIAELAKRSSFWAAALASVPLTSLLAFVWLYLETGSAENVATLSQSIFWLVIPSLTLFILLPLLLRAGVQFWLALLASTAVTASAYAVIVWLLGRAGIRL